jgi:hypothetical protein
MRGPAVVAVKRPPEPALSIAGRSFALKPVESGPVSLGAKPVKHRSQPGTPRRILPKGFIRPCIQRPTRLAEPVPARFWCPVSKRFRADKPSTRCLDRRTEWSFWNPVGSDRRGPKTHSRRTEGRLGRLRCARQGLVRESESNTKYGGKRGITGAVPRL